MKESGGDKISESQHGKRNPVRDISAAREKRRENRAALMARGRR